MKLKPLNDHIIIEPVKEEEKTESGIYLPEIADREKPQEGIVISVGPGRLNDKGERVPINVKEGDRVIFTKYGPNEIKIKDSETGKEKEILVAKEEDILAIIEK